MIDPGAIIGKGTRIWANAHVRTGAHIGRKAMVGEHCYIDTGAYVGDYTRIQNGVSVYRGVILADHVLVGPGVAFTNDPFDVEWPLGADQAPWRLAPSFVGRYTRLGANCTILAGAKIGPRCVIGAGAVVLTDVPPGTTVVGVWKGPIRRRIRRRLQRMWRRIRDALGWNPRR